jgi:riboflavin synthase
MFTGIVEFIGTVKKLEKEGGNLHITIESDFSAEAYIDQSISHNGVCLTVVKTEGNTHTVTAIEETLYVSNIGLLKVGSLVNLERAMLANKRLDGHFVQGHVDTVLKCVKNTEQDGSWIYGFELPREYAALVVHKGSVCINGVSLTAIQKENNPFYFEVAIIPYTYEHTNFKTLQKDDPVNMEFDILGKYILKFNEIQKLKN